MFSETQGRAGEGGDEGDGDGDAYDPRAAPDEDGEDEGGDGSVSRRRGHLRYACAGMDVGLCRMITPWA